MLTLESFIWPYLIKFWRIVFKATVAAVKKIRVAKYAILVLHRCTNFLQ